MATTGAVLYFRPRAALTVKPGRVTGAVLHYAARLVSGPYSTPGVAASTDLRNLKTWLPPHRVPIVEQGGLMNVQWYRFFSYLAEVKLGGVQSATLPDIQSTVVTAQEQASTAAAAAVGVQQQVVNNAEVLATVVEVAQNNSLSGASQIPRVQLTTMLEP